MSAVEDTIERPRGHEATVLGQVAQYEDMFRLCCVRDPAGVIVALAEQIG